MLVLRKSEGNTNQLTADRRSSLRVKPLADGIIPKSIYADPKQEVEYTIMMSKRLLTLSVLMVLALPTLGLSQNRPALVAEMGWADTILVNG